MIQQKLCSPPPPATSGGGHSTGLAAELAERQSDGLMEPAAG